MPILGAILLFIQACFAYHALKTGRPYWWLFVIMGFPVMGCVLYYFIEVFPTSRESRKAEKAVRALTRALDPDKELRARVADLESCGSVDNRVLLARECMEHRMYADAATRSLRATHPSFRAADVGMVHARAPEIFGRMLRNAERMPGHYRDTQGEWLKLARQTMQA